MYEKSGIFNSNSVPTYRYHYKQAYRTYVPYPYHYKKSVPYQRTVPLSKNLGVPYRTNVPYRTAILGYRYTFIFILDTTVAQLLTTAVLERNRYYLKTLAEIVQFLVVNELALRGRNEQFVGEKDFDLCFDSGAGNFVNMIKFTAGQDPQFHEALKLVPQNAKYTSASIQNESIFIFKDMMLCTISKEINTRRDLPFYCLKCDGTRDAEILSVVVRYCIDACCDQSSHPNQKYESAHVRRA